MFQIILLVGAILLAKIYFRGGVCSISHSLAGKVAVVTGGNTGIGK